MKGCPKKNAGNTRSETSPNQAKKTTTSSTTSKAKSAAGPISLRALLVTSISPEHLCAQGAPDGDLQFREARRQPYLRDVARAGLVDAELADGPGAGTRG